MKALENISQSWLFAGVVTCLCLAGMVFFIQSFFVLGAVHPLSTVPSLILGTAIFLLPSTILNWLYDRQYHVQTQRSWMRSPNSLISRVGYVLSGSVALWTLLFIGLFMAAVLVGGLSSLGQAAWST
jgi:hypothetical protein